MAQPATLTPPTRHERYIQLYKKPLRTLAQLYRQNSGYVGGLHPPEKWSKDDLVASILTSEGYTLTAAGTAPR